MLTGLLRPNSGSCSVMGHDVHSAAAHARQHIGYCPQANVLFGSLTVLEHLQLFCAIKGSVLRGLWVCSRCCKPRHHAGRLIT